MDQLQEELEAAFTQLKTEATRLRKETKSQQFISNEQGFKENVAEQLKEWNYKHLKEFDSLVSECNSMHGEEGRVYYEDTVTELYAPFIRNFRAYMDEQLSFDEQPGRQDSGNDSRSNDYLRQQLPERNRNWFGASNASNNNFAAQASASASSIFNDANFLKYLRKPDIEIEKFNGDPMAYSKFLRRFKTKILPACGDEDEALTYLEQFTTGEAHRVISGYSHLSHGGFDAALDELERRYGEPVIIRSTYVSKIMSFPAFTIKESKKLDELSTLLTEYFHATKGTVNSLNDPLQLQQIVRKLPTQFHSRWRNVVMSVRQRGELLGFRNLVEFVRMEASAAVDPIFGNDALKSSETSSTSSSNGGKTSNSFSHKQRSNVAADNTQVNKVCMKCNGTHNLNECTEFCGMSHEQKRSFVRDNRLCFKCFRQNHFAADCRRPLKCGTCDRNHPTSMHLDGFALHNRNNDGIGTGAAAASKVESTNGVIFSSSTHRKVEAAKMIIFPVTVYNEDQSRSKKVFAFVDTGSSCTYITKSLAKELDMKGEPHTLNLGTMGAHLTLPCERITGLKISSYNSSETYDMPAAHTYEKIPVERYHIPRSSDFKDYPHMSVLQGYDDFDGEIGLMLGGDVSFVSHPLEVSAGGIYDPIAMRTPIGWIPYGLSRSGSGTVSTVATHDVYVTDDRMKQMFQSIGEEGKSDAFEDAQTGTRHKVSSRLTASTVSNEDQLQEMFKHLSDCEFPEKQVNEVKEQSQEDKEFMVIVNQSITQHEGKQQVKLPVKIDKELPSNKAMAEQRLKYLKRKLERDDKYKENYASFMNTYLEKGYAEEVSANDAGNAGHTWYLPHHGVWHPVKKKLRVVYDCAAKYRSVSLNDVLLQGPNLTNSLIDVLIRFREGKIALAGDIEAMFLQVQVPPAQRDFLRFLWWPDGNTRIEPRVYRMCSHLFGATSSPAVASFALQNAAENSKHKYSEKAVSTVKRNFYVDDLLVSVSSEEEATALTKEVDGICKDGGFNIEKFVSNNRKVLLSIPETKRAKSLQQIDLTSDDLPPDRTLGMMWDVEQDCFMFNVQLQDKPTTHRGILSVRSTIFDPLGFLSPFILPAKQITQEACRLKLGWDDELPDQLQRRWNQWKDEAPGLGKFKVKRWQSISGQATQRELHHFSDASTVGYGTVSYLKEIYDNGEINVQLLYAKSRVAPLKNISIPRLELAAAKEAVKSNATLAKALDVQIDGTHYWTDSTAVLKYVNNRNVRFKTFVANRLEFIHSGSNPNQWHHVAGINNPADYASRGLHVYEEEKAATWFNGPEFLKTDVVFSAFADTGLNDDETELKANQISIPAVTDELSLLNRFSSLEKLHRVTAWILRFYRNLLHCVERRKLAAVSSGPFLQSYVTTSEVASAQTRLVKLVQTENYPEEISALQQNKKVKNSSILRRLDAFIDEEGTLRVGGRLTRSRDLCYKSKFPIILPKASAYSKLLVQHTHKFGHVGKNFVVTKLRQQFWIYGLKQLVKKTLSRCVFCRKYSARLGEQKMSDLPQRRVNAPEHVFTDVGLDYFGPFEVRQGRSKIKRYGCIFTCLASRAVHLEVAANMDTDSCINCIRRLIARRGPVKSILSDNGSNFVGANNELRDEIKRLEQDGIKTKAMRININWSFNTPLASHHGGVWESLIKQIRKCLRGLIAESSRPLSDDELQTLFCEVESILNSRPLIPETSDDGDALTVNHLLIGRQSAGLPPGLFDNNDSFVKRRWRFVQHLASLFWNRWSQEYLRTLNERNKWQHPHRNLTVGDVVLMHDIAPRRAWPLGRVIEVYTDSKGLVRSVKVRTKDGEFRRPIDKLCLVLEV